MTDVVGPVTAPGSDPPPDAPASIPSGPRREAVTDTRGRLRTTIIDCAVVAVLSVLLLVPALKLWDADLNIPFAYDKDWGGGVLVYERDAPFYLMLAEGLRRNDNYLENPDLGAPYKQTLYDFPVGNDNAQLTFLWVLAKTTGSAAAAVNLLFLLSFPAVAVTAFLVLRRLRISRVAAGVVALLFAFLPFHFARGTAHLFLSGYYMVPVAVLLVLRVLSDDQPFTSARPDGRRRLDLFNRGALLWFLGCAFVASTGAYYAAFTAVLLFASLVIDLLARREPRRMIAGALALGMILFVSVANLLPSIVYWARNGSNPTVVTRGVPETEVDGLKVSQLFLPVNGHRIPALAELQSDSIKFSPIVSERGQQLGIIGALGLAALVLMGLSTLLGRRRRAVGGPEASTPAEPGGPSPPDAATETDRAPDVATDRGALIARLFLIVVITVLIAVPSGVSLLLAGFVSQLRSWNRISLFIGFAALIVVALGMDAVGKRLPRWKGRSVLAVALAALVLVVGLLDQVSPNAAPAYATIAADWNSDRTFIRQQAATLEPGSNVFELPYVFFPEAGVVVKMGPYDHARGFLHDGGRLRWSWGGVRGRDADWQAELTRTSPAEIIDGLVAAGFDAVMIDRDGYADNGAAIETAFTAILGEPPIGSPNGRLTWYELPG